MFGHGDGGGGTKRQHLDVLKRVKNLDGLPKLKVCHPKKFFEEVEKEENENHNLLTWNGELYLELHRGTYTSQAKTKKGNRYSENLMKNLETFQSFLNFENYPFEEIKELWKLIMINQFHDTLPGTSIEMVYEDTDRYYDKVKKEGIKMFNEMINNNSLKKEEFITIFNSNSWKRKEVIEVDDQFALIDVPSVGYSVYPKKELLKTSKNTPKVSISETKDHFVLDNQYVTVNVSKSTGRVSVYDKRIERTITEDGNKFCVYFDQALYWEAWDVCLYHSEKFRELGTQNFVSIELVKSDPLLCSLKLKMKISKTSKLEQTISLTAISPEVKFSTNVQWNENRKFLKVLFPTDIQQSFASYEIQFGHLQRTTKKNTSWDVAKFEVSNQKWFDLSEYGYGVSILNDSKYGSSIQNNNTMVLSLLRSPKAPDANCDIGNHSFTYSLFPHTKSFQEAGVIRAGYDLNNPLKIFNDLQFTGKLDKEGSQKKEEISFVEVERDAVVLEAVKKAEELDSIILRFYESFNSKCKTKISCFVGSKKVKGVFSCNCLERNDVPLKFKKESEEKIGFDLKFSNFEIKTVKLLLSK